MTILRVVPDLDYRAVGKHFASLSPGPRRPFAVEPRRSPVFAWLGYWLSGRRGLIIAAIALAAGGLALGWNWLVAAGAAPLILSLAPCAAMCALGVCAMHKGAKSSSRDASSLDATAEPPADKRQLKLDV